MTLRKADLPGLLALAVVLVVFFARLGDLPFRDPDEGRNAQVALEMKESGAWLVPTYDGLAYLDKPAFFFRAVAISYSIFGKSEAAARLPSALFAALLMLALFCFCRREYPERLTASLAVMVAATSPLFIALARHVIFDMTLAFFVSAAIFCAYLGEADAARSRRWYLLGAAAAGFATLVKGPVGFVIPLLVIVVDNLVEKRKGWASRAFSPWNILAFVAVVLPWFWGLSIYRPDFPYYGLVEESFHRFTSTNTFQRGGPVYYYGLVILGGCFAWSLLLPEAAVRAWQVRSRLTPADRLFIVWTVVVVVFFSISKSKLPHYILTVPVALGALTARVFVRALANRTGTAARLVFHGLIVLAVLSLVAAAVLAPQGYDLGSHVRGGQHGVESKRLAILFAPMALALGLVGLAAVVAFLRRDVRLGFATFLLLPMLLLSLCFGGLLAYSESSSSRPLVRNIEAMLPAQATDAPLVCFKCFPPGLLYYAGRPVTLISHTGGELTSNYVTFTLRKSSQWPEVVVPDMQWPQWLDAQKKAFFLITKDANSDEMRALARERNLSFQELAPGWWGALVTPAVP